MKQELSRKVALVASDTPYAQKARALLTEKYSFVELDAAEVLVVLGGDGFMLETLHSNLSDGKDIYGMNLGTVGFLLNSVSYDHLDAKLMNSERTVLNPLRVKAWSGDTLVANQLAFNDVSVLRSSTQSAHLEVSVDSIVRMERLIGDGALVATSAGSSAYNASAGGPVIPLGAQVLALTPICTSSHRHWRGALLDTKSEIEFKVLDHDKRPVTVDADSSRISDVTRVQVAQDDQCSASLLFDPGHALEDRILALQFGAR